MTLWPPPHPPTPFVYTWKFVALVIVGVLLVLGGVGAALSSRHPSSEAKYRTILSVSGTGSETTRTLHVSTTWGVLFSYTCSTALGRTGNFIVTAENRTTTPVGFGGVNQLGRSGSGQHIFSTGGTVRLQITTECSWDIAVVSR